MVAESQGKYVLVVVVDKSN